MNLQVKIQTEDNSEGISLDFNVPIPDKHVKILKESGNLISAVTGAIQNAAQAFQNIKDEMRED